MHRRAKLVLLMGLFGLTACVSESTQMIVEVDADPGVAARAARLLLVVRSQEGAIIHSENIAFADATLPIRRPFVPRGGDAARTVYVTAIAASESGEPLTTARLIKTFEPGLTIIAQLRLYELCLGTNCPEGLTCQPENGAPTCVDARVINTVVDAGVDVAMDVGACALPRIECGGRCIDGSADPENCGVCGRACGSDQVCTDGMCGSLGCSGMDDCPTGTYCDLEDDICKSGCDMQSDCGEHGSCDGATNSCQCEEGYHRCGTECVSDTAATSCGDRCTPCVATDNGAPSCLTSDNVASCGIDCNPGFHLCDSSCVLSTSPDSCGSSCTPCPGSSRGTATCSSAGVCGLACNPGMTLCAIAGGTQDCIDTSQDAMHCGLCGRACAAGQICQTGSCIDPPNCDPNVSGSCGGQTYCHPLTRRCTPGCSGDSQCGNNEVCSLNACVCGEGYHRCGNSCVPNSAVATCGAACSPCPLASNASSMGCNGSGCFVASCTTGYRVSDNQTSCDDVNECLTGNGGCSSNATCINTPGSRTCTCNPGYSGDGTSCVLSMCDAGLHICSGTCVSNNSTNHCGTSCSPCGVPPNASGVACNGSQCIVSSCMSGYAPTPSGLSCADINECSSSNGGCSANATCTNTDGGRACTCNPGYSGNGVTCTLSSCPSGQHICGGACVSNDSVSHCGASCSPCVTPSHATGVGCNGSQCTVTACQSGFTPTANGLQCQDINECLVSNGGCDSNATCTNTLGSRECTCNSGYSGNGTTCALSSCPSMQHICSGTCVSNNSVNHCGTSCSACTTPQNATGVSCNGTQCVVSGCASGYTPTGNGLQCQDINECATGNGGCSANATCTNTLGGRDCTCNPGYSGNGVSCTLSSCPSGQHICSNMCVSNSSVNHCGASCSVCPTPANATSMGCNGSQCTVVTCAAGYRPTADQTACEDINECLSSNGGCSANATCTNTPGSRTCACNMGYSGNGVTCTLTSCPTGQHICSGACVSNNSVNTCGSSCSPCTTPNNATSVMCNGTSCLVNACANGYMINQAQTGCDDVNECSTSNGGCSANATCTNTAGSRTCACNNGYIGDGLICTADGPPRWATSSSFTSGDFWNEYVQLLRRSPASLYALEYITFNRFDSLGNRLALQSSPSVPTDFEVRDGIQYAVASTFGDVTVGGTTYMRRGTGVGNDVYLWARNESTGAFLWSLQIGGNGEDTEPELAVSDNSVCVSLTTRNPEGFLFGTTPVSIAPFVSPQPTRAVLGCVQRSTGAVVWANTIAGPLGDTIYRADTVGIEGGQLIAAGPIRFGSGLWSTRQDLATGAALGQFEVAGSSLGSGNNDMASLITSNGSVIVGTRFRSFGNLQTTPPITGFEGSLLISLSSSGTVNWSASVPGIIVRDVAPAGSSVYFAGELNAATTIGTQALAPVGGNADPFVARLAVASGASDYAWSVGCTGTSRARAVVADSFGFTVGGEFAQCTLDFGGGITATQPSGASPMGESWIYRHVF